MSEVRELIDTLNGMNVIELNDLRKAIVEEWGVSSPGLPPAAPTTTDELSDAPNSYDVVLTGIGQHKIQLIKVIREAVGVGLKEAKEHVDSVATSPWTVATGLEQEAAEQLRQKLKAAGADVEITSQG